MSPPLSMAGNSTQTEKGMKDTVPLQEDPQSEDPPNQQPGKRQTAWCPEPSLLAPTRPQPSPLSLTFLTFAKIFFALMWTSLLKKVRFPLSSGDVFTWRRSLWSAPFALLYNIPRCECSVVRASVPPGGRLLDRFGWRL